MKTLVAMAGASFGYFGFHNFQSWTYYTLIVLSICLITWLLMEFKMLPQYQMDIRSFFYKTFQAPYEVYCENQTAKQDLKVREKAKNFAQLNAEENVVEVGDVVETQETRRLRIEAENHAKEVLLEKERIEKKAQIDREDGIRIGRLEILAEQKEKHEFDYLQEHGISIEDNLIALEDLKNKMISMDAKRIAKPKLDPNATND